MMAINTTEANQFDSRLNGIGINETGNTTNVTDVVMPQKDPMITLTVPATMFAAGVFGNLLAILVLSRSSKEHKQTTFYRLVGALAVTDLVGTCAVSPITLAVYANNLKWVGGEVLCQYEGFMLVSVGFSTIFIIACMAVERFLAIKHPFYYDKHVSASKAKFIIIAIWLTAMFMGSLPLMGLGNNIKQFPGTWCFFTFTSRELKNQIYAYLYASTGLFMIGITAASNLFVTLVLLKMRQKAARTMNLSNTKRNNSELQMMILLLGIIVIFSTCWGPFLIRIIINQVNFKQVDVRADLYTLRLASLNQILDPWIYILFRKELFIRIIQCFKECLSVVCSCCRDSENNQRNLRGKSNNSHCNGGIEFSENSRMIDGIECENEATNPPKKLSLSKKPSTSSSKYSQEGTGHLRQDRGRSQKSLHLKHTACLFCFSNHPKSLVLASTNESKSVEELKHLEEPQLNGNCNDSHFCETCRISKDQIGSNRRDSSGHLSLEDIRTDNGCALFNNTTERTTRC